jgi:hypothetical protein
MQLLCTRGEKHRVTHIPKTPFPSNPHTVDQQPFKPFLETAVKLAPMSIKQSIKMSSRMPIKMPIKRTLFTLLSLIPLSLGLSSAASKTPTEPTTPAPRAVAPVVPSPYPKDGANLVRYELVSSCPATVSYLLEGRNKLLELKNARTGWNTIWLVNPTKYKAPAKPMLIYADAVLSCKGKVTLNVYRAGKLVLTNTREGEKAFSRVSWEGNFENFK